MVSQSKVRIMITVTKEQADMLDEVSKEMGISRSNLVQVATSQYVTQYKQSKLITADAIQKVLEKALQGKELDEIERLCGKNIL